jgi:hypothetical protein
VIGLDGQRAATISVKNDIAPRADSTVIKQREIAPRADSRRHKRDAIVRHVYLLVGKFELLAAPPSSKSSAINRVRGASGAPIAFEIV